MKKRWIVLIVVVLLIAGLAVYTFFDWGPDEMPTRNLTASERQTVDAAFNTDRLVVSTEAVYLALVGGDDVIVVGVINPVEALVPLSAASYNIPGAQLVWRPDYSAGGSAEAISPAITGVRRSVSEMEALLSRADVTADSRIVVYAAGAMHDAARFVWQMRMLGHDNVWYMDGGMNAWIAGDRTTGSGTRMADNDIRSSFTAQNYDPASFDATIYDVIHALQNPDEWVVIDTRARAEFDGEQTGSSAGAFGTGRIAGSVFIPWNAAVDPDTQLLRSQQEIEELFLDAIAGRNVIVYCQSGVRSAHTWLVLTEILGLDNVWNYDGSWIEWSYAASSFGTFAQRDLVLSLTEEWSDNNGAI